MTDEQYQAGLDLDCLEAIKTLLSVLRQGKPNDRSELARRYQITMTEAEKLLAYFQVYVVNREE